MSSRVTTPLPVPIGPVLIPPEPKANTAAKTTAQSTTEPLKFSFSGLLDVCLDHGALDLDHDALDEETPESPEEAPVLGTTPVVITEATTILLRLLGSLAPAAADAASVDNSIASSAGGSAEAMPPETTTPEILGAETTKPSKTDLAFAIRVTEAGSGALGDEKLASSHEKNLHAISGSTKRQTEELNVQSAELKLAESVTPESRVVSIPVPATPVDSRSDSAAAPQEIRQPETANLEYAPVAEAPRVVEPPKLAVRLDPIAADSTGKPSVEVLVEQRGASLHFSVHSADSSMAADMRASLGDLTAALERQGFDAQSWHPVEAVAATREADMSGSEHETNTAQDRRSSGGNTDQHQQQRQGQDRTAPGWLAELESSLFAPDQLKGVY